MDHSNAIFSDLVLLVACFGDCQFLFLHPMFPGDIEFGLELPTRFPAVCSHL